MMFESTGRLLEGATTMVEIGVRNCSLLIDDGLSPKVVVRHHIFCTLRRMVKRPVLMVQRKI